MGTCLAVIKVIGTTSLGLYAGVVATNAMTNYDILIHVLNSANGVDLNRANELVKSKIKQNSILLSVLGSISSIAFHLAYFQAPKRFKHPYLIYASLVFPVSSGIYYFFTKNDIVRYFQLENLINDVKGKVEEKKEVVKSELDNSVYKDLGDADSSNNSHDENGDLEDEEIENEVNFHLNQKTGINTLTKIQTSNKIVAGLSTLGFIIATIGVYGDH